MAVRRLSPGGVMRRVLLFVVSVSLIAVAPARADHLADPSAPNPVNRLNALVPKPAGTFDTIVLQYGPYVIHPGSDLIRVDAEPVLNDFQVIAARPAARRVDGTEPPDEQIHIHHAHWVKPNPESSSGYDWFFGTGEERTRGGGFDYMAADADRYAAGIRYGNAMRRGEAMGFISMLHNKTSTAMVVWLEGRFEIVWGSREEIKAATAADPAHPLWGSDGIPASNHIASGIDFRPLLPVLHGDTFQVPKTGGMYTYPLDVGPGDPNVGTATGRIQAGVGHLWTAPTDGMIVIGAGHLHPGGTEVIVSNLGSQASPCASGSDGIPGTTIASIDAYYRMEQAVDSTPVPGRDLAMSGSPYFPSEEFQMGITQNGWRAYVRAGDRIAINGTYDTSEHAFPDAMSFFGFYMDTEEPVAPAQACTAELTDSPGAPADQVAASQPNRLWDPHPSALFCNPCDDPEGAVTTLGQWTNLVTIGAFVYAPGNLGTTEATGVPWVNQGESLTFVNADWAEALVRHSITSCAFPCNGGYYANYPFHDGTFDSGSLGFTPVETYERGSDAPVWTLDTSDLEPDIYSYYCRLHPTMKGSFAVV